MARWLLNGPDVGLFGDNVMKLDQKSAKGPRRIRQLAFTLAELLVSVALVSVVVVSLYGGIVQGMVIVDVGRDNMRATQLMVNTMEVVRLYNWDQINSNGYIPTNFVTELYPTNTARSAVPVVEEQILVEEEIQLAPEYREKNPNRMCSVDIRFSTPNFGTSYDTNMRQIDIRVTWTNQNVVRWRTMSSLIAEEGLQKYVFYK